MERKSGDWRADGEIAVFNMVFRVGILEKVTLEQRLGRGERVGHADKWSGERG